MRILSIDASTKSSGWCIGQDGKFEKSGCVAAASKNVNARIIKIRDEISKIIKENNIDNKVLMWLQAAIVLAAYEINPKIQCEFIGATEWRAALKIKQGRGIKREMLKPQDIKYVEDKYSIKVQNDDQADAICIFDAYWEKNDNEINWE